MYWAKKWHLHSSPLFFNWKRVYLKVDSQKSKYPVFPILQAAAMGFPKLAPSLAENASISNGVVFAVARSPVLDCNFFTARGVRIPPSVAPLNFQMSWFKKYLDSICFTLIDCADKASNSTFIVGDVEANNIAFPLIQGYH